MAQVIHWQARVFRIKYIQEQYDRGREAARTDAENGIRKVYIQLVGGWGQFLFELLRDRYGIFAQHVSDITTVEKLSYEAGYNSIAHEYIETTHGEGTMQHIDEEVHAFRAKQYRKYLRACLQDMRRQE
mgnify:CR=1 FL=1